MHSMMLSGDMSAVLGAEGKHKSSYIKHAIQRAAAHDAPLSVVRTPPADAATSLAFFLTGVESKRSSSDPSIAYSFTMCRSLVRVGGRGRLLLVVAGLSLPGDGFFFTAVYQGQQTTRRTCSASGTGHRPAEHHPSQ